MCPPKKEGAACRCVSASGHSGQQCGGATTGRYQRLGQRSLVLRILCAVNMVAPIQLIKAVLPGMRERRWGRIINITSMAVKMPLPRLGLSNGARSGLTGFSAGLAREVAQDGVTINNLLPGRFATSRLTNYLADVAKVKGRGVDGVIEEIASTIPVKRIGRPDEFGAFCLFIASEYAGYMTGQSILLDGGEYPGTFSNREVAGDSYRWAGRSVGFGRGARAKLSGASATA